MALINIDSKEKNVGGMYLDEMNSLKVLSSEQLLHTNELQNQCNEYVTQIENFKTAATEFAKITVGNAEKVEKTRLRSVGLNCMANQVNGMSE